MKLGIADRFSIMEILPKQGNFITLSIVQDIIKKITITQDDLKKYNIRTIPAPDGMVSYRWDDAEGKIETEIEFTDTEKQIIVDSLRKMDNEKKISLNMIGTYKKFMNIETDKRRIMKK